MNAETVWVVVGHSESGDEYRRVFRASPTEDELSELAHNWDGDDDKEGPGFDGSYVHLTIYEEEVN
jgi:hypothetical protein